MKNGILTIACQLPCFTNVEFAGSKFAFSNTKSDISLFANNKTQLPITDSKFSNNGG